MMKQKKESARQNPLLNLFFESLGYKNLRLALDKVFERPIWWFSDKKISSSSVKPLLRTQRACAMDDYLSLSDHKSTIMKAIRQSERTKVAVLFKNNTDNTYGISAPLVMGNKTFGFFGICGIKTKPKSSALDIVSGYTKIIIEAMTKEEELSRVYGLVRPRAIALSTVHTINRLITSTLDIKELFPRIARLSLQVLRAERASICMINEKTGVLHCVASVDYKKSTDLFKLKARPLPTECKVAKTGRSVRRDKLLCIPLFDENISGVITVREKVGKEKFTIFDQEILTTLAEQAVIAIRNAQLYKEQEDITLGTIKSLSHLLDAKFPRTYTHTEFFVALILEMGKEIGLNRRELKILHYSALLPDLGKVVMPEEILKKKKALSGQERRIIKSHTVRGIEVLKYLDVLKPVIPIILHHHERYDGKGYPYRLKGKKIPLGSRIMAVADTFEAMVCHRPYRPQRPFRMAISEIRRQALKQFDPDVVKAFMHLAKNGRLEELVREHRDELNKAL